MIMTDYREDPITDRVSAFIKSLGNDSEAYIDAKGAGWIVVDGIWSGAQIAEAIDAAEKAIAPTDDDEREARNLIRRAVGGVLFNASNFPEQAQIHVLGQNMAPLNEKLTNAVLAALHRSEVPEPSAESVPCPECGEPRPFGLDFMCLDCNGVRYVSENDWYAHHGCGFEEEWKYQWEAREAITEHLASCDWSEPQGEPSDAQLRAAVNAWHRTEGTERADWYDNAINRERMRAALRAAGATRSEPSDAEVLDADALSDLLDEMNKAGVMPELPFRDAQDIAGVAYLVDEGDTTRAVFLSDPGEDRVQYDGHSEDDASYVGLFERPIDELHGPITVLRAAGGVR